MATARPDPVTTEAAGSCPWLAAVEARTTTMAERALEAMNLFLTRRIALAELTAALRQTGAVELLDAHWSLMAREPEAAPALEILQLIAFWPDQATFQVERYGANSVVEDREQLAAALARLTTRLQTGKARR